MATLIILLLLLLCFSAFFAASETTLFSLSRLDVHRFKDSKTASAKKIVSFLKMPSETLVTVLLGNEFANVSISIVGAAIVEKLFNLSPESETIVSILFVAPLVLLFGEFTPKNLALRYASPLASFVVWPLSFFYKAVLPVRVFLTKIADSVSYFFGCRGPKADAMIMEEEFRKLVDMGSRKGVIVEEERDLIHKVFDFTDKKAGDIMTPLSRVFMLPADISFERLIEEVKSKQFSRVPFYDGDKGNVIGILHVKEFLLFYRQKTSGKDVKVDGFLHPPLFVSESIPLESLLREFQKTQLHMAVVKGNEESVKGLITMGDVLGELFGEFKEQG